MPGLVGIEYEGLAELSRALREVDAGLLVKLREDLSEVGDVVRDDARARLTGISPKTAAGIDTRVRAGGASDSVLTVGQSLRKTTFRRADWGSYQVREILLPAVERNIDRATRMLEDGAFELLRQHGF